MMPRSLKQTRPRAREFTGSRLRRLSFRCFLIAAVGSPALPVAAQGNHYYDRERIAQARAKVAEHGWAQRQQRALEERVVWVLAMSDRELWEYVPPVTQRRALNVAFNVGCPIHGTEILRRGGPYPWIMTRERAFKVECPVGGEVYPNNDFVPWHHGGREGEIDTTEAYVDDGTGYRGPDGQGYHFVAHYIFWQRWRGEIVPALGALRDLYLLTDDKRYARSAAIILARIAAEYPRSDYARQAVHRVEPPHEIPGGILDYIWENGAIATPGATAFDAIAPVLDDPEVVGFIRAQGIADVRRHIEDHFLHELVNRITGGRDGEGEIRIRGNFGMYQRSLATLAVVLNNDDPSRGLTRAEAVDWIMRPGAWHEVGAVREALWNRFYRDGHGGEASPGYSAGWANSISSVAQILGKLDTNLYDHPKMRRLVNVWLDLAVLGKWAPSIGDAGDIFGSRRVGWYRNILLPAYQTSGDPRWAKALEMIGVADNQLWETVPMDRIQEDAARFGEWPAGGTRLLGGYGLAIAESPSMPVGMSLFYGYAGGGHGHRDRLNIEMFAHDRPVLPDHGYPTPLGSMVTAPKRFLWTSNTIAHYGVTVNRKWQQTLDRGRLNLLASAPGMQVIDASAEEAAYPGEASLYRRTSLLIENQGGQPYLFDIFRVAGGWEHVWSFHGPPMEVFETFGLDLGPVQEEGTLAGREVGFGEAPADSETDVTSGFQYLFNVRRAPPPAQPWGATWSSSSEPVHLRMTSLTTGATEVVLADCEPELKPDHPKTMPYLLAFNGTEEMAEGEELNSDFVAVVEPYVTEATLGRMSRLATEGAPHAVAASLGRLNGEDLVVSHLSLNDRSTVRLAGNNPESLVFEGELAHLALDDGKLSRASLVNVVRLESPWLEVEADESLTGRIARVDYERNLILLDRLVEGGGALAGQTVVVGNDLHSTAFQIASVEESAGATALLFGEIPIFVGMGQVEELRENGLVTRTEFGQWQVDGGKHEGRWLVEDGKEHAFFIDHFDEGVFQLQTADRMLKTFFAPDEGSEKNRFWIAETGAGDWWKIPGILSMERGGGGNDGGDEYQLTLNTPVRVGLHVSGQGAGRWVYRDGAGEWASLAVSREGGKIFFQINPAVLRDGKTAIRRESTN